MSKCHMSKIKPRVASNLHNPPHESNSEETKAKEEIEVQEKPCQSACQAAKDSNEVPES